MADLRSERTVSHFLIIKTHNFAGRFKAIGVLKNKDNPLQSCAVVKTIRPKD